MILQWDESFDIGSDTLTGVNDADYKPAVRADGQAEQADDQGRPAAVVTRGHQEAGGGDAGKGEARLILVACLEQDHAPPGAAGAFTIDRPRLAPEDEKKLVAAQRNNKTRE